MREIKSSGTYKDKAEAASTKPADLGEDIGLSIYDTIETQPGQANPSQLPSETKEKMLGVGVSLDNISQRSATFIQMDNTPAYSSSRQDGIEVMATSEALEKYDWLSDYW